MTIFYLLEKSVPPLVNDDDQGPAGAVLRKTNSIFIERKDGICYDVCRFELFSCSWKYLPQKT